MGEEEEVVEVAVAVEEAEVLGEVEEKGQEQGPGWGAYPWLSLPGRREHLQRGRAAFHERRGTP